MSRIETVLVTGGAGYVGAVLVPKLLHAGYFVKVIDLFLYGNHVLDSVKDHPNLEQIRGFAAAASSTACSSASSASSTVFEGSAMSSAKSRSVIYFAGYLLLSLGVKRSPLHPILSNDMCST